MAMWGVIEVSGGHWDLKLTAPLGSHLTDGLDHLVPCDVSDKPKSNDVVSAHEFEILAVSGPGPWRGPSGSSYSETACECSECEPDSDSTLMVFNAAHVAWSDDGIESTAINFSEPLIGKAVEACELAACVMTSLLLDPAGVTTEPR